MADLTMADFLRGRDQALEDLAWERTPEAWLSQQGKGAVSGLLNPFNLPQGGFGWLAKGTRAEPIMPLLFGALNRWRDDAPYANTFGSLAAGGRGMGAL